MIRLTIWFILLPGVLLAQSATFYAGGPGLGQRYEQQHLQEVEWRLQGKSFRFGGEPVEVKTNPGQFDTLFYRYNQNSPWSVILCRIAKPSTYRITYNLCCDGFNVTDASGNMYGGQVAVQVKGPRGPNAYLIEVCEGGMLLETAHVEKLSTGCGSAMSNNIRRIAFSEIEVCKDSINCPEKAYLIAENDTQKELPMRTVATLLECDYMPLDDEPIRIMYNTITRKLTVKAK